MSYAIFLASYLKLLLRHIFLLNFYLVHLVCFSYIFFLLPHVKNLAAILQRFLLILPVFFSGRLKFTISERDGQTCSLVSIHD